MPRQRVLLVCHAYLEKLYRSKLRYLSEEVDLRLVSPEAFPFAYGMYRADFPAASYEVRAYPCIFPLGIKTSTRWILKSRDLGMREFRPDIIHVENELSSFVLFQALLYRAIYARNAKVVVFVWANQRPGGLRGLGLRILSSLTRGRIDFFIAGASAAKRILAEDGVTEDRIRVIPQIGVSLDHFRPPENDERNRVRSGLAISPNEFVIGFVGRFVRDKGLQDLIQAFITFKAGLNGTPARLMCIGTGPLKDSLLQRVPDSVVASPGSVEKTLSFYHAMDVLVLPSRTMPHWEEQFGMVLAEAMACGIPVIGSSSGAIPEVIGDAGATFPEGDTRALADALRLAHSLNVRSGMGARGIKRARECFSGCQISKNTLEVYRHLQ